MRERSREHECGRVNVCPRGCQSRSAHDFTSRVNERERDRPCMSAISNMCALLATAVTVVVGVTAAAAAAALSVRITDVCRINCGTEYETPPVCKNPLAGGD